MAFKRRLLSELLQTTVAPIALVGLGDSPPGGGWSSKAQNTQGTIFTPFVVIDVGVANLAPTQSYGGDENDWRCTYKLGTYGISVDQVELIADNIRGALESLTNREITLGSQYLCQQVREAGIGNVVRIDATDPPYYTQNDTYEIWLSKEL